MHTKKRSTLGRLALTLAMIAFLVGLATMDAGAEQRLVIVNGQALTAKQLVMLDNLAGGPVPNGSYWIDPYTATWGFAGDPTPQGHIGNAQPDRGQEVSNHGRNDIYVGTFTPYRRDTHCILISATGDEPC